MKKLLFSLFAFACLLHSQAQTFTATYPFTSVTTSTGLTDPTAVPTATGITFGSFNAHVIPLNPNASTRFSFINWPQGATTSNNVYSSLTGSLDPTNYYQVTLTPASGYSVALDSIRFSTERSATGTRTYAVRSSLDGYTSNLTAGVVPANPRLSVQAGNIFFWNFDSITSNQNGSKITLGGTPFGSITSPITFRFYGWNSEASSGTFSIDNVNFYGAATQVQIAASYGFTTVCESAATAFTDNSSTLAGTLTHWHWDFGDTQTADFNTLTNPTTHTYATCGNYNVKLVVTNSGALMDSTTQLISVVCNPSAAISPSPTASFCAGDNLVLDAGTGTGLSYVWKKDGTVITGANANTYSATLAGSYVVVVTNTNTCTATSSATVVSVNASPTSAFSYTAGTGGDYTFNSTSTGATGYTWNFGDTTAASALQSPTHTYLHNGNHNVCLKVTSANACTDSICHTVSVSGIGVGIEKIDPSLMLSISPNPSRGMITLDVTNMNIQSSAIKVFSIIGKEIEHLDVSQMGQDLYKIDLSSQVDGFYFVRVYTPKEVFTWRVAISR